MFPEYDSWKPNQVDSELWAIFHALSGSLNILSDVPLVTNCELIKKSLLPSGHLLKPDRPLTLCEDSFFPQTRKTIF